MTYLISLFNRCLFNYYYIVQRCYRRYLLYAAIFFVAGIIGAYYFKGNWIIVNLFLLVFIALFYLKARTKSNRQEDDSINEEILKIKIYWYKLLFFVFIIVLMGSLLIIIEDYKYNSYFSIASYNNQEVKVLGEIKEDLGSLEGNYLYIKPYLVDNNRVKYGLIQLDKRYLDQRLLDSQLVELRLFLKEPEKAQNPGNFSYYHYLKKKGIYSQGYQQGNIYTGNKIINYRSIIISFKKKVIDLINKRISQPYNQVIKALILGERSGLPDEWEELFTEAGINHLLAISGLHVGFILFVLLKLFELLRVPETLKNCILTFLLVIYILLTGMKPSVLRAGLLAINYIWATFFRRKADVFNILGFAIIINLIINPYDLFTAGFQLTYMVVVMILIWNKLLLSKLPVLFSFSIAAQLGAAPLTAYYFNYITPVGILTNIWAVPLLGFVVSLMIIVLIISIFIPVFLSVYAGPISLLLSIIQKGAEIMAALPGAHIEVATPSLLLIISGYLFLLLLAVFAKEKIIPVKQIINRSRLKTGIVLFLIIIILQTGFVLFDNKLEVYFLSVDQGDSIYIKTPSNHHVLVDGGGYAGANYTQEELKILPFFKYRGVKKLDLVVVTHFDADHALGVKEILRDRNVSLLALPTLNSDNDLAREIINLAHKKDIPIIILNEGDILKFGDVNCQVLNPPRKSNVVDCNNNSIVFHLEYKQFSLLLTGDLEKDGEYRLIGQDNELNSVILKLGHHGSKSSSSAAFLRAVSPLETIVSVGRNNYGHPSTTILERVEEMGIRNWRTDEQGAVIVKSNGKSYTITSYK